MTRPATLAAFLVAALSATGLAALTAGHGAPHFPATPVRAHVALGPAQTLAAPGADDAATSLAEAARARYGRIDALIEVRARPLPFADGALLTGVAIRWD